MKSFSPILLVYLVSPTQSTNHKYMTKILNDMSDYLISSPDGRVYWLEWILDNPECMLIPGKRMPKGAHTGDSHFSKYGHSVAAKHFIKNLLIKKSTI